jgi:hypothetical protein
MDFVQIILMLLDLFGVVIVGVLTVPVFDVIKHGVRLLDDAPAWVKQLGVPVISALLGVAGTFLQTPLPDSLELFDVGVVESALSAAIAMAVKAGKQS